MKNAQQAISTQCLLAVTFKRIDLNPESPSQLMTSPPSTQARALLDTCLSLPPVMQLISKFYIFSFGKKNCHLIIAMTFLLVSPALSFSPSNSSFPVDWVSILPSLQTLIVCSYSIRAKLGMWYPKFFHNLVPDSHSILCSGLLFQKCFQSFTQLFLLRALLRLPNPTRTFFAQPIPIIHSTCYLACKSPLPRRPVWSESVLGDPPRGSSLPTIKHI